MALRCINLLRFIRNVNTFRQSLHSTTAVFQEAEKVNKVREYRTENNIVFYEDPDTFGTLSRSSNKDHIVLEDKDDIEEEKHIRERPLDSQKLTIKQYSDIIKQYLKHKRLKEAINVLEIRMLKEDRVKPESYIYNILIGACADVGYTKKAFKLYNDMKRRALKPTGDTYTCLFHACYNSPWAHDGLKNAKHLRELMIDKGIEPNLTNYNAMIKAFGKCGDLTKAFQIVDEMRSKNIKIRVHTFNHLLQACISDKENGLRHALIVWRKMLKTREKPNIYSFNLMLKCVKECNMGSKDDIVEMLEIIQKNMTLSSHNPKILKIESEQLLLSQSLEDIKNESKNILHGTNTSDTKNNNSIDEQIIDSNMKIETHQISNETSQLAVPESNISIQIVQKQNKPLQEQRTVPNLLSKNLQMDKVLSLQGVQTVQDKFAVVGGQEDFLKEMSVYSVKPDIKTFTQMLPLLDDTREAEIKLLDTMKSLDLKADIDFYNMLIKKRCLRKDYDGAFDVKDIIEKENKIRKKRYPLKKKLRLQPNIMTYGVLAMACKTKESADTLLKNMKEEFLKVNIEILGTLLRQGTANSNFGYVIYIMNVAKEEKVQINNIFLRHLEEFYQKCLASSKDMKSTKSIIFTKSFEIFRMAYKSWLKDINIDEVTKPEHPWAQFNSTYPETVQRQNFVIQEPKKFYKRNKKYVPYSPRL